MATIRAALAIALLVAGCESPTAQRHEAINEAINSTTQAVVSCYSDLFRSHLNSSVIKYIIYTDNDPRRVEKLASSNLASMSEKLDIILYYRDEAKCRAIAIEGYGNVHPSYTIVYVNYFSTIDRIVAEVIKAKITYGDANDSILEALQNLQRDINEVDNALDTELANSYAYEEAKRREAIVALQNWIYVQQYLLNAQRTAAVQQGAGHYHVQQEMQCTYMGGNRIRCDPY